MHRYPQGTYATLARTLISQLTREQTKARSAALAKAKPGNTTLANISPGTAGGGVGLPGADSLPTDPKKLAELLQRELKRVGCYPGTIDGDWGARSRAALQAFNQHARKAFAIASPSAAPIIELRKTFARICPETKAPKAVAARPPAVPKTRKKSDPRRKSQKKVASSTCRTRCLVEYRNCSALEKSQVPGISACTPLSVCQRRC